MGLNLRTEAKTYSNYTKSDKERSNNKRISILATKSFNYNKPTTLEKQPRTNEKVRQQYFPAVFQLLKLVQRQKGRHQKPHSSIIQMDKRRYLKGYSQCANMLKEYITKQ